MIQPGSKLAHYEIVSALGKGGMGEVWRARDTKLGREVAIKTLPAEFAGDVDRLARFEREAKLLASLNHPNIAAIYGIEEDESSRFLVLELVEGNTLGDRIKQGAIPVEESLTLALQIADALKAAHESGVIHRDLKPDNIKVGDDGNVKVLDFGLAKALSAEETEVNLSNSPTLSMAATQAGLILGTAPYMSPEQAKGRAVDRRTDVFAFGCVLYEMLTGQQSFGKSDVTESLSAVISLPPDWETLPRNLHPGLRKTIERCLEKQVANRYQDIGDVRLDIETVLADPAGPIVVASGNAEAASRLKFPMAAVLAGVALVAALGAWVLKPVPTPESPPVIRFYRDFPDFGSGGISPDGRRIAYRPTSGELYLWEIGEFEPRPVPGVEPSVRGAPIFSPDGQTIAYWDSVRGQIEKIPIGGGLPVPIADAATVPRMSWGSNGVIVYTQGDALMSVSANGGVPEVLLAPNADQGVTAPGVLPDGGVLFTRLDRTEAGVESRVEILPPGATAAEVLFDNGADGVAYYSPTGHIVYDSAGTLFARPFDLATRTVGNAVPLIEGVGRDFFVVSASGTLWYGGATAGGLSLSPVWVDRSGTEEEPIPLPRAEYGRVRVSPDGTRVAVDQVGADRNIDIWVYDLDRGSSTRLTRDPADDTDPIWMDAETVVFSRNGTTGGLFRARADGSGEIERLTESSETRMNPYSVSSDGSELIFIAVDLLTADGDVQRLRLTDLEIEDLLASTEFLESNPALSPDNRLLAYMSNESGDPQIYVRTYPNVGARRWTISTDTGFQPVWARDGRELFYQSVSGLLMRVEVTFDDDAPVFGRPERLFDLDGYRATYDIHPDGERFLMLSRGGSPGSETSAPVGMRLAVVVNWDQELLERVPVD